jgi:cytochrome b6-f complex iron-sulfur subunit
MTEMTEKKEESNSKKISRSQFLGLAWIGAGALVAAEAAWIGLNYLKPQASGGFGGMVYAGKAGDFPINSVTHIVSGRFYIVHLEGGFLAIYQRCTHLGCAVPYVEGEDQFHCPCHGSLYNHEGVVIGGPAPRPMDIFPITIQNGDEIWVDTSKPTQRSGFDPSQLTVI